jgi:DNA-binding LytR/AlgR family response regulator
MRILIVEDEKVAYEHIASALAGIDPSIEVAGHTESIDQTVHWLQIHPAPDLILMDIHLSDSPAFAILGSIQVEAPILVTTASGEHALHKLLSRIAQQQLPSPAPRFKDRLLIPQKDKLIPVGLREISCFYTTDRSTRIYLKNGLSYPYAKALEQISASLNPTDFFRANKQFIIARDSVKHITIWFDNRLLIALDAETPERIYVSKNRASEFKAWVVNE